MLGGLGFSMKWNMGWMNDTLDYFANDPIHRRYHHDRLTFGQLYAYSENFVLPISHDEVVHGKGSLLGKMPGDEWQRFANLRLLLTYQMTAPGKKLLFMGCELAQGHEWRDREELPWHLLQWPQHQGMKDLVRDLNRLYAELPALHDLDFSGDGFSWIDCHDADQSVISWLRQARDGSFVVVVLNLTPVPRKGYRIGVPATGSYRELLNSDSRYYGGSDLGNDSVLAAAEPILDGPAGVAGADAAPPGRHGVGPGVGLGQERGGGRGALRGSGVQLAFVKQPVDFSFGGQPVFTLAAGHEAAALGHEVGGNLDVVTALIGI